MVLREDPKILESPRRRTMTVGPKGMDVPVLASRSVEGDEAAEAVLRGAEPA